MNVLKQFESTENVNYLRSYLADRLPTDQISCILIRNLESTIQNFRNDPEVFRFSDPSYARARRTEAMFWQDIQFLNKALVDFIFESYAQHKTYDGNKAYETGLESLGIRVGVPDEKPIYPHSDYEKNTVDPNQSSEELLTAYREATFMRHRGLTRFQKLTLPFHDDSINKDNSDAFNTDYIDIGVYVPKRVNK
jgi:hypothetical protein